MSSCGYCTLAIEDEKRFLPLQCRVCNKLFHLHCLNCEKKPTALLGDQLFDFCCSFCSTNGRDSWTRLNLNWVHVIYLALYNLMSTSNNGREGFFRWNTGICKYIETHWSDLMPNRHKTSSWQCTVAGILSVNCPTHFRSGTQVLGENGWWSLQNKVPLKLRDVLKTLSGERKGSTADNITEYSRKRSLDSDETIDLTSKKIKEDDVENSIPVSLVDQDQRSHDSQQIVPFTERQEQIVLNFMSSRLDSVLKNPPAARFFRKLKVRQKKRELHRPVFDLDKFVQESLESTEHYISSDPNELPVPLRSTTVGNVSAKLTTTTTTTTTGLPFSSTAKAKSILNRLSLPCLPILSTNQRIENKSFVSPYTSHVLLPHIFKSSDFLPPKVQILQQLVSKVSKSTKSYQIKPVLFSYFRKGHLPFVNNLISYFFWPVNLNEYLQYPDFTVVALYDKLVIGCGFMTPDVSVSEAYIPFLLVHPDFQRSGIGQIMLYHLIQSCQGKDITLHVSVDNPAMFLYQKFGFKVEQFCINFYDKYYPPNHYMSKHAFFMRLRR